MLHTKRASFSGITGGTGCTNAEAKLQAHRARAAAEKHRRWLASPEGQAAQAREDQRARLAEERAAEQQRRSEEEQTQREWGIKFDALREKNPESGTTLEPLRGSKYKITVQQDPRTKELTAFGLARVTGDFPAEPYRYLANGRGRWGLKVFLNKASRDALERLNSRAFDACRQDPTHIESVFSSIRVKVIGPAGSGKAVHGEFVP